MIIHKNKINIDSQTAIEYLLLFTIVAIIVFVGFKNTLPKTQEVSTGYYNKVSNLIMGEAPANMVSASPPYP